MILIWGKGRVWEGIRDFLNYFWIEYEIVDDKDCLDRWRLTTECIWILEKAEWIIPSPWVPSHHALYSDFREKLVWELDLVWDILQKHNLDNRFRFVWVTGTDWKSTVSHLIHQGLERLWKKAFLAGNFEVPFARAILNNLNSWGIGVVEVSSFMAYLIKQIPFEIVAWTNFAVDHLDWHRDLKDYFEAKVNLANRAQRVLTWFDLEQVAKELGVDISYLQWQRVDEESLNIANPFLVGQHNQKNLALAGAVLQGLGFELDRIKKALSNIKGLPHRIEFVGQTDWGVKVWDDGKSTTPQALWAALGAMEDRIVLIAWWYDKGADFEILKDLFKSKVSFGVFLWQTSSRFAKIFDQLGIKYVIVSSMEEAVNRALDYSHQNWVNNILFSPACASFDMFKNRKDRVEKFLKEMERVGKVI